MTTSLFSIVVCVPPPDRTPYAGWTPCVYWCKANCKGFWSYDSEGAFRFELASDASAFTLKWS
jgi:hypothetical protein